MSIGSEGDPSALENLSALTDGELDSATVAKACSAWHEDGGMRSNWHAYQLIGDVLRSDDLASSPAHDAAFLSALRQRLATEPTVLAPDAPVVPANEPLTQPAPAHVANAGRNSRWSWMAPSAVAAGFVLVAGALVVTRGQLPGTAGTGTTVAATSKAMPSPATAPTLVDPVVNVAQPRSKVIRDARLDSYLAAHQQFAGTSALGVPSGFLRNAAAEAPNR